MKSCLTARLGLGATAFVIALATGCSAPGLVEGVVFTEDFQIADPSPALRAAGDSFQIILSEEDGVSLRLVNLQVPEVSTVELGEKVELFPYGTDGQPTLRLSQGELDVTERSDGARILSSHSNRFAEITSGTLILYERGESYTGTFTAALEDGGYIDGSFSVTP